MAQPVAVVFVHGINLQEPGYEKDMQAAITRQLQPRLRGLVEFEPVFWAKRVRTRQKDYRDAVAEKGLFRASRFRGLVVEGLGDAAAYQKTKGYLNSSYFEIQEDVRTVLEKLDAQGPPDRPLIFIAHSLGCHIVSSFIWDINTIKNWDEARIARADEKEQAFANYLKGGSPFRRLDTTAGLVMMGSNMPLFTFTFGPGKIMPITRSRNAAAPAFPGAALDPATRSKVRWDNYYSRNDLLGYPLKPLNAAYDEEPLLRDIDVASEGRLWRLYCALAGPDFAAAATLAAHTGYWTNSRVVDGAADLITAVATADETPVKSRFPALDWFRRRA